MRTFAEMNSLLRSILDPVPLEYTEAKGWKIYPGPQPPDIPTSFILATPYGGPGLELEGALDGRSWQIRCVGKQTIYTEVENVANAIDIAFLSWHTQDVGGVRVTSIQRVGGAPAPLQVDDAERVHFACSYILSVELALSN
jgi:hypothetical protein